MMAAALPILHREPEAWRWAHPGVQDMAFRTGFSVAEPPGQPGKLPELPQGPSLCGVLPHSVRVPGKGDSCFRWGELSSLSAPPKMLL